MKVCLSYNLPKQYLEKADEIRIDYKDNKLLQKLYEHYPDKAIILKQYPENKLTPEKLNEIKNDNLIICLSDIEYAQMCKDAGIQFYYGFPVSSYFQLEALKDLGVCYVRLDAPLFFDLDNVKKYDIPIRAVPNVAYNDGLPRIDGVCGTWIRPEDLDLYEPYVSIIEFEDCNFRKEEALYRIYMEDHKWDTDLGLLITNLNHIGSNRMIFSDISISRLNCHQECAAGKNCHICYRMLDLANPEKVKEYAEKTGID